jgi:hypothetical protein
MYFDILRIVENPRYKFLLDSLDYIVLKPPSITAKINAFTPLKLKNKCLNRTESF